MKESGVHQTPIAEAGQHADGEDHQHDQLVACRLRLACPGWKNQKKDFAYDPTGGKATIFI